MTRNPPPAMIDSQSIRAADTVLKAGRGWDNAKKVNGRKRHIAVATSGLLPTIQVTAASVQNSDATGPCCGTCVKRRPGQQPGHRRPGPGPGGRSEPARRTGLPARPAGRGATAAMSTA
jgi:hypothetical protein